MDLRSTRDGFGKALLELGKNLKVVVLSADLSSSTRAEEFAKAYPERFLNLGVAEQNLIGVSAGLALSGKIVFATSFACFSPSLNWAQIRQSVCYGQVNVKIIGSHGGLATGPDGAIHQALEDIALMRVLPKITIVEPIDYQQAYQATLKIADIEGPAYLRLHRPKTSPVLLEIPFEIGQAQVIQEGKKKTLIGSGPILAHFVSSFSERTKGWEIINCHTIKPLDKKTIINSVKKTGEAMTLEDHQTIGGLGSAISEVLAEEGLNVKLRRLGVEDSFGESARDHLELWEKYIFSKLI